MLHACYRKLKKYLVQFSFFFLRGGEFLTVTVSLEPDTAAPVSGSFSQGYWALICSFWEPLDAYGLEPSLFFVAVYLMTRAVVIKSLCNRGCCFLSIREKPWTITKHSQLAGLWDIKVFMHIYSDGDERHNLEGNTKTFSIISTRRGTPSCNWPSLC